jgi:hypothetical protein
MEKLSIEEKAKAYDEAKARMSRAYNDNRCTIGFMNEIFPETKESEDKRIRKELIYYFNSSHTTATFRGIPWDRVVDWLEKQGKKDEEILILNDQIESLHAAIKALKEAHKIELEKKGEKI